MYENIKKEVVVATLIYVVVLCFLIYSLKNLFNVYDLGYLIVFTGFYIRYLKIKKKQKDYIWIWYNLFCLIGCASSVLYMDKIKKEIRTKANKVATIEI